jgi:hypothetical protein
MDMVPYAVRCVVVGEEDQHGDQAPTSALEGFGGHSHLVGGLNLALVVSKVTPSSVSQTDTGSSMDIEFANYMSEVRGSGRENQGSG